MPAFLKSPRRGDYILARTLALILLCMPVATALFMYLDVLLLMASQRLDNVYLYRPVNFADRLQIYVVSLPDRHERRADMERLRLALGLHWEYANAVPANNALIGQILDWVKELRSPTVSSNTSKTAPVPTEFLWPEHLDDIAKSGQEIPLINTNVWEMPTSQPPYQPLTCNKYDYDMPDFSPGEVPKHMRLTPARVACWHSHLSVIHQHANSLPSERADIGLILEDDVDMENDILAQMESLWATLPVDWDMVFLGHCWSDETRGRLLPIQTQNSTPGVSANVNETFMSGSRMYVSTRPKCTHAYAVSRIGARRLLLHLTYPLFAYSRAIDQGFAWLVESGRIRGFSVVPNLVIQRKVRASDVMEGGTVNSQWKDTLVNSVFDMLDHNPHQQQTVTATPSIAEVDA